MLLCTERVFQKEYRLNETYLTGVKRVRSLTSNFLFSGEKKIISEVDHRIELVQSAEKKRSFKAK